jgi:Mg2+ and Co2+ transporter CorA
MTRLEDEVAPLLVDGYLDGLPTRPLDELRQMRERCQRAETKISFLRRLAQGRLDIIHAFLDRREDEGDVDLDDLVADLTAIMAAGPPRPEGPGRLPPVMVPDIEGDDLAAELDRVIDAEQVARLATMSLDQLRAAAEQLAAFEARLSQQRRALHERIDRLQREIVERYKTGGASADELLP